MIMNVLGGDRLVRRLPPDVVCVISNRKKRKGHVRMYLLSTPKQE